MKHCLLLKTFVRLKLSFLTFTFCVSGLNVLCCFRAPGNLALMLWRRVVERLNACHLPLPPTRLQQPRRQQAADISDVARVLYDYNSVNPLEFTLTFIHSFICTVVLYSCMGLKFEMRKSLQMVSSLLASHTS